MPTTMYCGNSPESWIRGGAVLDKSSGIFSMTLQLETDSTSAGPVGRVVAALKDSNGTTLTTVTSKEIGTGGKPAGSAAIRNFDGHVILDPAVTTKETSVYLDAQCTGSVDRQWNVKLSTVKDALALVVTAGECTPALEPKPLVSRPPRRPVERF